MLQDDGDLVSVLSCKHDLSTGSCLRSSTSYSTACKRDFKGTAQFDTPIRLVGDPASFTTVSEIAYSAL